MELAIAYYSLALSYTPPNERDLKATILSNRSLMYQKTGKDEEALRDAQQCVQNNPNWAKVTNSVHLPIRISFLFNLASHGTPNVAGGKAMRFVSIREKFQVCLGILKNLYFFFVSHLKY